MEAKDFAKLSPSDGAVTLRSLARRFRSSLRPTDDDNLDEFARRVGSGGSAPIDHLVDASRSVALLHESLRKMLREHQPVLAPGVTDTSARAWPGEPGSLEDELDLLGTEAEAFAVTVERAGSDAWSRTATVAGGDELTALDVLREAVRTAITDLRAADQVMTEVRRS